MSLVLTYFNQRFGLMCSDSRICREHPDGTFEARPGVAKKFTELGDDLVVACTSKRLLVFRQILGVVSSHYSAYPPQLTSFDDWVAVVDRALEYVLKTCPIKGADLGTGVVLMGYDKHNDRVRCVSWGRDTRVEAGPGTLVALEPFDEDEDEHITERIKEHMGDYTPERLREAMARVVAELAAKHPAKVGLPLFFHTVEAGDYHATSDNFADGATFGRLKNTALTANEVDLSKSGVVGQVGTVKIGDDAVTAAKRVDGAIAQDVPDNRLWNAAFVGTAAQRALGSGQGDGSPNAPTGYGGWETHLGNNENDGYTGNGEYNLHNHATVPHSIQELNEWSMVGNPTEECVLTVEVKLMTATTPSHDFRVSIIPWDGTSEGTPNEANFAGSSFNNSSYKQVVFKTTLPNLTNLTKYIVRLRNMSTGNTASDGYRVRRAMLSRSVDIPRWTPNAGRDRASQQVTGGGGGGGGGGTGGGSGCEGGCVL